MNLTTLGLVLLAAVVHALWNVWLKRSGARLEMLVSMALGWGLVALAALPFTGLPAPGQWPFLVASTLIHIVYSLCLIASYRIGDLALAYPVSRGTGPLVVTFVSIGFLGERVPVSGLVAVALIIAGVLVFGWSRRRHDARALALSLVTGCMVGVYSLVDGLGSRAGPSPHAYAIWMFLLLGVSLLTVGGIYHRARFWPRMRTTWKAGLSAGVVSAGSYWVAIWAMSVAPMPLVAAVRESSVAFAALFGWLLLRERVQWLPVALVLAGVVLIRLAKF